MAEPRPNPYVWATWLSKQMAGEESCGWKLWFRANHTYDRIPSSFDLARRTAGHTQLLHDGADDLREQGYAVYPHPEGPRESRGAYIAKRTDSRPDV
jgi:hypothetical protein